MSPLCLHDLILKKQSRIKIKFIVSNGKTFMFGNRLVKKFLKMAYYITYYHILAEMLLYSNGAKSTLYCEVRVGMAKLQSHSYFGKIIINVCMIPMIYPK